MKPPPAMPERTRADRARRGLPMGGGGADGRCTRPTWVRKATATWNGVAQSITASVADAIRAGATRMTVVPGSVAQPHEDDPKWNQSGGPRLGEGYQFANVVELLRRLSAVLEPHKLVMVLEPLNWRINHGGGFLRSVEQGYAVCTAFNSPSCKILFDMYHEQITPGNLLNSLDAAWDIVAYLQSGDNPGRKEPSTGEVSYRNVFQPIAKKGYKGGIGMEHGSSKPGAAGEQAVIGAYRAAAAYAR